MAHNSTVADESHGPTASTNGHRATPSPLPIPELVDDRAADHGGGHGSGHGGGQGVGVAAVQVTDEERNRFGALLDSAAERGLLTSYEYEARLRDLAVADTVDELRRIVADLPAFTAPAVQPSIRAWGRPRPADEAQGGKGRSRWIALALLVVVVTVSLVFLAVEIQHLAKHHAGGAGPPRAVSALRL